MGEHLVVAGVLRRDGRALMVHRTPQRDWYPDSWDLPGGHVRAGESPRHALVRELEEELGITADVVGEPLASVMGPDFRMDIWLIDAWAGDPVNREPMEHDGLAWLTEAELQNLPLADPRLPQLLRAALSPVP